MSTYVHRGISMCAHMYIHIYIYIYVHTLVFQKEKASYGDPTIRFHEKRKGSRALATLARASLRLFFRRKMSSPRIDMSPLPK